MAKEELVEKIYEEFWKVADKLAEEETVQVDSKLEEDNIEFKRAEYKDMLRSKHIIGMIELKNIEKGLVEYMFYIILGIVGFSFLGLAILLEFKNTWFRTNVLWIAIVTVVVATIVAQFMPTHSKAVVI